MSAREGNPLQGWHLDKRVPIALIAAIILQTGAFGIWIGAINQRVTALESRTESMDEIRDRMVRVETLLETIVDRLDRQDDRRD